MNRKLTILAVVALVAGLMALGAEVGQAAHLACGDTLTAPTTLDADLT